MAGYPEDRDLMIEKRIYGDAVNVQGCISCNATCNSEPIYVLKMMYTFDPGIGTGRTPAPSCYWN